MTSCTANNNTAAAGGAIYAILGATISLVGTTISTNTATLGSAYGNDYYVDRNAVISATNCTLADGAIGSSGSLCLAGNNTIVRVLKNCDGGTVTISSGASINLTSSIAPGGGVTISGGANQDHATVIYSGTPNGSTGSYEYPVVISGTEISSIGEISGATITSIDDSITGCAIYFIKSGESVISDTLISLEDPYDLVSSQGAGAVLVRVTGD